MLIERHILEEKLAQFEERCCGFSPSPAIFHSISVALRYGDAQNIEMAVAMAILLRESAQNLDRLASEIN